MGKLANPTRPWYLRVRSIQQIMAGIALGGVALAVSQPQPQGPVLVPTIPGSSFWTLNPPAYANVGIDPRFIHLSPVGIDPKIIVAAPLNLDDKIVVPR